MECRPEGPYSRAAPYSLQAWIALRTSFAPSPRDMPARFDIGAREAIRSGKADYQSPPRGVSFVRAWSCSLSKKLARLREDKPHMAI